MEVFLRTTDRDGYTEFNFSPSTRWAAWRFRGYRAERSDLDLETPTIKLDAGESHFALEAELVLPACDNEAIEFALAAVIEEMDGTMSYWAQRHPEGRPDFHHGDCFQLTLPPPGVS